MELIPLQKLYEQYKEEFKKKNFKPHPSVLVAMLLFQEIDKYKTDNLTFDEFYEHYKISEKVKQVILDFAITKEEIRGYDEDNINLECLPDDEYYYAIGYDVFSPVWSTLKKVITRDDNLSPEEIFEFYTKTNGWLVNPTKDGNILKLQELYEQYKQNFNRTGYHPHPSELLSLLLLPEKEKYKVVSGNSGEFYQYYKEAINKKIEQVIVDFVISKAEIFEYIKATNIILEKEDDYEKFKIWAVFSEGFGVLQWGLMYHPDWSPEKLHNAFSTCWGRKPIPEYLLEETKQKVNKPKRRARRKISTATTGFKN